jgi:hypothetical protein
MYRSIDLLRRFYPLLVALALLSLGCESDTAGVGKKTDVTLQVKGTFGKEPLLMYTKDYAYEAGMRVKWQLFQFYISDVSLLRQSSTGMDTVELLDIDLVSFKDVQTEAQAGNGHTIALKGVPEGEYAGLVLGLGVSPALNAGNPGNYTPPHPLDGNYWSWARGYVFTKIEGNADLGGNGQFGAPLTFHIGENEFYRTKTFQQPIVIDAQHTNLALQVDLRRVLALDAAQFLDFRQVTQDHTTNRSIARFIADNLPAAITMPLQ